MEKALKIEEYREIREMKERITIDKFSSKNITCGIEKPDNLSIKGCNLKKIVA